MSIMGLRPVITVFPTSISSKSRTMLPFLYQTRTITSLRGGGTGCLYQPRHKTVVSRRSFRQCAINLSPNYQAFENEPLDEKNGKLRISRNTPKTEPERFSFSYHNKTHDSIYTSNPNTNDAEDDGDYNSSIVRRTLSRVRSPAEKARILGIRNSDEEDIEIPWVGTKNAEIEGLEVDELFDDSDNIYEEQDEINNLTRSVPHKDRESTITPSEKQAFQKIFSDIFERSQKSQKGGDLLPKDGLIDNANIDRSSARPEKQNARSQLDNIVATAARQSQEEMENAVNRYPPALRAAAARAIGLKRNGQKVSEDLTKVDEPHGEIDKLEEHRKPERDRVEDLMHSAKTDFELWAIMEKEVFPLIHKLGLDEKTEPETVVKKRGRKQKEEPKSVTQEGSEETSVELNAPGNLSPLAFYGPLYPSYLLLGLRLLERSFAKPSPYTLSMLPKIKSLGIISHVLGASTSLYNELLLIYWYRLDDFQGFQNLLREMDQSGLDWDDETLEIIEDVARTRRLIARGDRGLALKALWSLSAFAPDGITYWRHTIRRALEEKNRQYVPRLPY
jgi:hypothetical protein